MSTKRFVVGLDAGGSNTSLLAECGECSGRIDRRGPGANPQRTSVQQSAQTLATLVQKALRSHDSVGSLLVCAGVSGAGQRADQEALVTHLRRALTNDADVVHVEVVHDAHIALDAAFGSGSGLVVIVGTGSVVLARARDETMRRAGGWGYLLGDPGSGYAMGRAGLRAVGEAFDGGANTSLQEHVKEQCGIDGRDSLIRRVYQDELAPQNVAPLVMEASADGDSVATDILNSQADALVDQVEWLLGGGEDVAPRISLFGGVLQNDHYALMLRQALQARAPNCSIAILQHEPVVGALRRARDLDA